MEASNRCLPCAYPGRYDALSIRWMKQENKLCEKHALKASAVLEIKNSATDTNSEKKINVRQEESKIQGFKKQDEVKNPRNWQDREPGSDD